MIQRLIDLIAPDYCCGCSKIGSILCGSCFYDITETPFNRCVSCLKPIGVRQSCAGCRLPYQKAWVVGWRQDVLERLIDISKFDSARRACLAQARLLDATLPQLPAGSVIVPIPTTRPHIRRRGYGHTELIARQLAKLRGASYQPVLRRRHHSVQHGATRAVRLKQAKQAFYAPDQLDADVVYLVVDDVYTTGATVRYATKTLGKAGASTVWLAITSRQPID